MKLTRGGTRTRAAGVGTRRPRGRQRGRGTAEQLLAAAAAENAATQLIKPIAKHTLQQAAELSANYAATRFLERLSKRWYKRKQRKQTR